MNENFTKLSKYVKLNSKIKKIQSLVMVVYTCNIRTWEAETEDNYKFETSVGYVVNYRAAWANE